ncbi:hypothetical protein GPECTOR_92g608 [Gonium pectorale]|uniref:Uncharacterized protein n=1 Tax=Gonium pectorale TaxID=33097 RepID=A0A150G1M0_GONPE|nr:hypothetical protein GPECTOR_92g608 [Gonium pectorale]|eukprot:KXZ43385.1 hypothetical protein GPECTOR_92g608 [Gonium pectorale]
MAQAAGTASKALQAAQAATDRAEAAMLTAAAAAQARPPPSAQAGPIPFPAPAPSPAPAAPSDPQLLQRLKQVEAHLAALQEKVESQKAKEEFARQLRAAQAAQAAQAAAVDGVLVPPGATGAPPPGVVPLHHSRSMSNASSAAGLGSPAGSGRPSNGYDAGSTSASGGAAATAAAAAAAAVIDGSGLLPPNNNFPSRFGGPGGLRAARERTPGRPAGPGPTLVVGEERPPGGHHGSGGGGVPPAPGPPGELLSTHRYGTVLPSDLKLAEQRRQGPKQFL